MIARFSPVARGLLCAALVFLLDQASKAWILDRMQQSEGVREITPFFNLVLVWNQGISFGMLSGHDARLALLAVTGFITLAVLAWLWKTRDKALTVPLGLIIGGSLGNILDRLRYGAVVDFLDVHAYGYHWPAFNVADSAIVIGVSLIAVRNLFTPSGSS